MTQVTLTHDQLVQLHDLFSARVAQLEEECRLWGINYPKMADQRLRDIREVKDLMQVFFGSDSVAA